MNTQDVFEREPIQMCSLMFVERYDEHLNQRNLMTIIHSLRCNSLCYQLNTAEILICHFFLYFWLHVQAPLLVIDGYYI